MIDRLALLFGIDVGAAACHGRQRIGIAVADDDAALEQEPLEHLRLEPGDGVVVLGDAHVRGGLVLGPDVSDDGDGAELERPHHLTVADGVVAAEEKAGFTRGEEEIGIADGGGRNSAEKGDKR